MKWLILFIGVCICSEASGQKRKPDTLPTCSAVADELSYYWKLDSLANNGFRRCAMQRFLTCKIDGISADSLLAKLGKPNRMRRTDQEITCLYYYFDKRTMPKDYDAPMSCAYIRFTFKVSGTGDHLFSIDEGDMDL